MHGALPHAQVMCAQPTRKAINGCEWVRIPPLPEFIRLSEDALAPLRPSPVIAVALNTFDLGEDAARRVVEETQRETGLPTTDPERLQPGADRGRDRGVPCRAVRQLGSALVQAETASGGESFPRPFSFQQTSRPANHSTIHATRRSSGSLHDHAAATSASAPAQSSASR